MWYHQEMNSKFYIDSDYESLSCNNSKMETEVRSLKHELTRTREDLKLATKRCRELVHELSSLTTTHETERILRDRHLSKILRALLVLESRLRQEQKSIRHQLCEKDNVIKNQQLEIAKLRRYTKNYIKIKRDQKSETNCLLNMPEGPPDLEDNTRLDGESLGHDIQKLKREIIKKFSVEEKNVFGVRKNDSFAGSDVSKESLTSSETTDGSIVTTTTDGLTDCPSLISTEGFCEGESTDVSPGSTLVKSKRRIGSESDCEGSRGGVEGLEGLSGDEGHQGAGQGRVGGARTEGVFKIVRSDSKDDGMDCNFGSEEEGEPIYVNSWSENNERNLRESETRFIDDSHNNNHGTSKITEEKSPDDSTGNWYSDPDEDRLNDDIIRHNTYRPNSNHNSVLECVNQILLRDMEDDESILSVSRKFKHRGRIVSFQAARLSDIESVGSEMERRNSEEIIHDKDIDMGNYEGTGTEDEYGMKITNSIIDEDNNTDRAIPILIIEPKNYFENGPKNGPQNGPINGQQNGPVDGPQNGPQNDPPNGPVNGPQNGPINGPVNGQQNGPVHGPKNGQQHDPVNGPRNGPVHGPINGQQNGPINGPKNGPLNGPVNGPMHDLGNGQVNGPINGQQNGPISGQQNGPVNGPKNGPLNGSVNGPMNDLGNGPVNGPKNDPKNIQNSLTPPYPDPSIKSPSTLKFDRIEEKKCLSMSSQGLTIAKNLDYEDIESLPDILPLPRTPPALPPKPQFIHNTLILKKIPSPSFLIDETRKKTPETPDYVKKIFSISKNSAKPTIPRCLKFEKNMKKNGPDENIPRVTNIVRHFEEFKIDEKNEKKWPSDGEKRSHEDIDIRQNFEEFNLDDLSDLSDDPDRHEGDGSERLGQGIFNNRQETGEKVKNGDNGNSNGIYDHFLEATGLSTKSILTPSRLLSNHKSMLKPKDVKYKNMIKGGLEKFGGGGNQTQVRHWTGPFV